MKKFDIRQRAAGALVVALALFSAACGSGGPALAPPVETPTGNAFVFIGDAPPPGSTILKFEITLSDATLCPQVSSGECQGSPQVALLSAPVEIELTQLELQSAFLSLKSVEAGTYAGVKLTFASPELKILLADGTLQELEAPGLTLNPTTVTPTFDGGVTVGADTNFGFLVDFNVADSVQSSGNAITGIAPVVTLVKLAAGAQQAMEEMEDTSGRVSNLSKTCPTGTFTLIHSMSGVPVANIRFDASTEFEEGLTCDTLANDQIVEVDVELRSQTQQAAEFYAKEIELVNHPGEEGMEGVVFQVNSPTEFVLMVQHEENLANLTSGSLVTVNLGAEQTEFRIDADELPVESSLFDAGDDLLVGQTLEVDMVHGSMMMPSGGCGHMEDNCTASAEKLKLKKGTLTARVSSTNDPNFNLDTLPSIFGTAAGPYRAVSADCQACFVPSIHVATSAQTEFEDGLTGVSGLTLGDTVTVRGLLFKNGFAGPGPVPTGAPHFVAQKVRRQTD